MNSIPGNKTKNIKHFRELEAYKVAFSVAMEIFNITKAFPSDEKFSLVSQIRRSSRSVCSNLAEAWRKRRYISVFKNKLTDSMQEASETQTWLEFALACGYIDKSLFYRLDHECERVIGKLSTMERKAQSFCYHS